MSSKLLTTLFRLAGCIVYFLGAWTHVQGQSTYVELDTVIVRGVTPIRYLSGIKIQQIDSAILTRFRFLSAEDLLSATTPLFFKSSGVGQLSTISFRGTASVHTAVLWNGLNINLPTLGQTDFSTVSLAPFNTVNLQYGAGAALFGSDAVGGSILLDNTMSPAKPAIEAGIQYGSFSNWNGLVKGSFGNVLPGKWSLSGKSTAYGTRYNNRFPYEKRGPYYMRPSETGQWGFTQDLFLTTPKNNQLSVHLWGTRNKMTLSPGDVAGQEITDITSYRTMVRYVTGTWNFHTAWVKDIIDYGRGVPTQVDHGYTDRFNARMEKEITWSQKLAVTSKAGVDFTHYRSFVKGYDAGIVSENRTDFYLLTRWAIHRRWTVALNLRQALFRQFNPPLTPSLGMDYALVSGEKNSVKLKGSIARSYRVPTLNERYWKDLGNPDIRPEDGFNKELGIFYQRKPQENEFYSFSVNGYHNRVNDWTYWNPARNYRVENLQLVVARGGEISSQVRWVTGKRRGGILANYALNRSSQEKLYAASAADIIGKQLTYVPRHTFSGTIWGSYRNTELSVQFRAVSRRFTTFDNTFFHKGYYLVHLQASQELRVGSTKARLQLAAYNITNSLYLNVRSNAMPGRNYSVNLLWHFGQLNSETNKK